MIDPDSIEDMLPDRWRYYYVHRDGWVTEDIDKVQGKCVGVVEAKNKEDALAEAKERGLL
jgi:hypothetical protein